MGIVTSQESIRITSSLFNYPVVRPRRLRSNVLLRNLVAETMLRPDDLVMPIFVKEGINEPEPIKSMPGQYRYPLGDKLINFVDQLVSSGVKSVILFGIPEHKDEWGSSAYDEHGIIQRTIRLLKDSFEDRLIVMADVCLCEYTDHGHCGVVKFLNNGKYVVDNDTTIGLYAKTAVTYAESGVDVVAPSGMMDGQVRAIREALDRAGFQDVAIMAYSAKYASSFFGPFREAASSAPRFGDRRTYQMDPRNAHEALKEVAMDIAEGADMVMVKPATLYLDVIRLVKENFPEVPLAAYQVSGEYAMLKAAIMNGWLDEKRAVLESLIAIRRAGADVIITYFAKDVVNYIDEQDKLF
ncbi:porphobilinogen synthase [Vulcanisaeta thermophila]|uniref:porphobilinogen synthase n=1 Tax=Vulcanisaeta thermophila TaxID=867917 RepID=UPI000853690B|nr:porphobilinogen synthase [Vulcanisaeta thermophila]